MFHGCSQSGPSVDRRRHHRLRDRRRHHRRRRHHHGLRGNRRLDYGLLHNGLLHNDRLRDNDRLRHHHGLLHDRRRRVPRRVVGVAGGVIPDVVVPAAAVMGMDEATPPADKARRAGTAVETGPVAPARRRRRRRRAVEAHGAVMPGRRRRRAVEAAPMPMPGRRRRRTVEAAGAARAAAGTGAAMHAGTGAAMHAGPRTASARPARPARSAGTATGPARMRKHHARAACDKRENQFLVIHVMPPSCCVVLHVPYSRKGAPPAAV